MNIYMIVLDEPNDSAWQNIQEFWPEDHFIHTERVAFIADNNLMMLTSDISTKVGIGEVTFNGIAVNTTSYYGHSSMRLWEWLAKASKAT